MSSLLPGSFVSLLHWLNFPPHTNGFCLFSTPCFSMASVVDLIISSLTVWLKECCPFSLLRSLRLTTISPGLLGFNLSDQEFTLASSLCHGQYQLLIYLTISSEWTTSQPLRDIVFCHQWARQKPDRNDGIRHGLQTETHDKAGYGVST